jgi:hypothetical protein
MKVKPTPFSTLVESNIEYLFRIQVIYIIVLHETCARILLTCLGQG